VIEFRSIKIGRLPSNEQAQRCAHDNA
jgi:hypothetical protein